MRLTTLLSYGQLPSTGYFNTIKYDSNRKKRFVKIPLSAPAFGQNKPLKSCQNNFVINTGPAPGI
jgi:hypothetical protein